MFTSCLRKLPTGKYISSPTALPFLKNSAVPVVPTRCVWYIDTTPGHDWLMGPVNELVQAAIAAGGIDATPIGRLAPFIEQMGTQPPAPGNAGYRKEFWWEREWRHAGAFALPERVIVLCPEAEFPVFRQAVGNQQGRMASFIDPRWGLEQIISRLTGYGSNDSDIL